MRRAPGSRRRAATARGPWGARWDREWGLGPAGKWPPAQTVTHLARGLALAPETFQPRKNHAPMNRRPGTPAEKIAKLFIFGLRSFPPGRKAPERTTPASQIDRASAEAHFLAAVEAWDQVDRALLPERRADLFVKHPRMGDLTVEEWMRFHLIHARHHARQIRQRLGA